MNQESLHADLSTLLEHIDDNPQTALLQAEKAIIWATRNGWVNILALANLVAGWANVEQQVFETSVENFMISGYKNTNTNEIVLVCVNNTDANSLYGNPLFVNSETGDFTVYKDSPALEIGFKNFPMNQFGVQKESFKKIYESIREFKLQSDKWDQTNELRLKNFYN